MTGNGNPDLCRLTHYHLPGYDVHAIVPLGAGLENTAWLVNDELVIRKAKTPDPDATRREAELLATIRRYATLPTPDVVCTDPDSGLLAYRVLTGSPLIDLPDADMPAIAAPLGTFLAAIHAIPLADVEDIVPRDDEPLGAWLDEAVENYETIASHLAAPARTSIDAFLAAPIPPEPDDLTFCHNDFGAEHILVDPAAMRITGIIDWTDAAMTDPVRDLALILRDLGPDSLRRALSAYSRALSPDEHSRLHFYARCKLIEDIAYGIESGETRYVGAAHAHLGWTF
nr:APH [uncultured bacterium]